MSALIRSYEALGSIHGIKIARGAPSVSNLFFANDSYFFFNASVDECLVVKKILQAYSEASRQVINYQKSAFLFSSNITTTLRKELVDVMDVQKP